MRPSQRVAGVVAGLFAVLLCCAPCVAARGVAVSATSCARPGVRARVKNATLQWPPPESSRRVRGNWERAVLRLVLPLDVVPGEQGFKFVLTCTGRDTRSVEVLWTELAKRTETATATAYEARIAVPETWRGMTDGIVLRDRFHRQTCLLFLPSVP